MCATFCHTDTLYVGGDGVSAKKQKEFIRIIEKVKRGNAEVYRGILLKKDDEMWYTISQGPEKTDRIEYWDFHFDDYTIEPTTKEEVEHYFKGALVGQQKKLLDAEFELEHQKMMLKKQEEFIKEVMG